MYKKREYKPYVYVNNNNNNNKRCWTEFPFKHRMLNRDEVRNSNTRVKSQATNKYLATFGTNTQIHTHTPKRTHTQLELNYVKWLENLMNELNTFNHFMIYSNSNVIPPVWSLCILYYILIELFVCFLFLFFFLLIDEKTLNFWHIQITSFCRNIMCFRMKWQFEEQKKTHSQVRWIHGWDDVAWTMKRRKRERERQGESEEKTIQPNPYNLQLKCSIYSHWIANLHRFPDEYDEM